MRILLDSDEYSDSYELFEDFKNEFFELFKEIFKEHKVIIEATNSDWRGRTGYATVDNSGDLLNKVLDGNHFESMKIGYDADTKVCKITSYGHDVPTGCSIELVAISKECEDEESEQGNNIVYDDKTNVFIVAK